MKEVVKDVMNHILKGLSFIGFFVKLHYCAPTDITVNSVTKEFEGFFHKW